MNKANNAAKLYGTPASLTKLPQPRGSPGQRWATGGKDGEVGASLEMQLKPRYYAALMLYLPLLLTCTSERGSLYGVKCSVNWCREGDCQAGGANTENFAGGLTNDEENAL